MCVNDKANGAECKQSVNLGEWSTGAPRVVLSVSVGLKSHRNKKLPRKGSRCVLN